MLPSIAAARFVAMRLNNDHQGDDSTSETNRTPAVRFLIASLILFALATATAYLDGRFAWSALVLAVLLVGSQSVDARR